MKSNKHIRYMNLAKQAAAHSDFKRSKTGCVVTYKDVVLAIGYNTKKTHPLQEKYNKYRFEQLYTSNEAQLHAETMALSKIRYLDIDFSKVNLYVYRIYDRTKHGLARPCLSCMQIIKDMGISTIYYTTNTEYIVKEII